MKSAFIKIFFLGLIFAFFVAQGFSFGGSAPQVAVGHIKYYGNSPFEFAGFETEDGYLYTLKVDDNPDFSLSDIEKEIGSRLEITGKIVKPRKKEPNTLRDGVFIVSEWKRLSENAD